MSRFLYFSVAFASYLLCVFLFTNRWYTSGFVAGGLGIIMTSIIMIHIAQNAK